MSVASQFSFGNAAVLTSGTIPGDRGVPATTDASSFVAYSGNTIIAGQFNNSTTNPTATTRLNYNGILYATSIIASIQSRIITVNGTSSISINSDTTDIAKHLNTQTAGSTLSIASTGTPVDGQKMMLKLLSTSSLTLNWNSIFAGSADLALPLVSTGNDKYDYMGFIYNEATTKWHLLAKNFGF
jgi:hypothetical protein